jgi:hypothetical protein
MSRNGSCASSPSVSDMWVITTYYNPSSYKTKCENYYHFLAGIRQAGLPSLTVECAFGSTPFDLPAAPNILQIRANSVMWQKERLLNIAIAHLPDSCTKVAWVDCDILFENKDWAILTSKALDQYQVVQSFESAVRLPKGQLAYSGEGDLYPSFCAVRAGSPKSLYEGYYSHGHTGFAWAARRDVLVRRGLYDACLTGSGDHLMAHAFCGDWESKCVVSTVGRHNSYRDHFIKWADRSSMARRVN